MAQEVAKGKRQKTKRRKREKRKKRRICFESQNKKFQKEASGLVCSVPQKLRDLRKGL